MHDLRCGTSDSPSCGLFGPCIGVDCCTVLVSNAKSRLGVLVSSQNENIPVEDMHNVEHHVK